MRNIRLKPTASVLILVLIVISSMMILSVGLAYRTRVEMKLAGANAQRTKAYYLALGGIERAKALLTQQELSLANIARICQFDGTAKEERLFDQLKSCDFHEKTSLSYCLRDEQGYLNINKSDPSSWENLGIINKESRACIIDWIDPDDDTSSGGAETDFYGRLEAPYITKNAPCITLKELLFVKTIARNSYLGENLNRRFFLDAVPKDKQPQIPADKGEDVTALGLVNIFTVYGDGKININTVSKAILSALPGLDSQAAEIILAYRSGLNGRLSTDDDICIEEAATIANIEGLTELQIELLEQYCCFGSEYFRIFSHAALDNTFECCLVATVKTGKNQPQIICLERLF